MNTTKPAIHTSTIAKIVPMTITLYAPILECGHVGQCATSVASVGDVGDRRRCLICTQQGRKQ